MSAMSEKAAELDEARKLSGIDLVECERDHYKALCAELLEACKRSRAMFHYDRRDLFVESLDKVIAKAEQA